MADGSNGLYEDLGAFPQAVERRAQFLFERLSDSSPRDLSIQLDSYLNELAKLDNGYYWIWVCVTGCYPVTSEYKSFHSHIQIHGLPEAVAALVKARASSAEFARFMNHVELVDPPTKHLADISHTSTAPFVTGIQRVVREILGVTDSSKLTTFHHVENYGIFSIYELNVFEYEAEKSKSEPEPVPEPEPQSIIKRLEDFAPKLAQTFIGLMIYRMALPVARILKKWFGDGVTEVVSDQDESLPLENLFIGSSTLTLMEIAARPRHIETYEVILEENITNVQVLSYDFVPIFHAWTVFPGSAGHFLSYLRIVLLAHRVITISDLVEEQINLVTKAFQLERVDWAMRRREVTYLPLPSGIAEMQRRKFVREPNLFVMVGSLEPRKNYGQFLDALEILFYKNVSVKARLISSTGWKNAAELDRIKELQMLGVDVERVRATDEEVIEYVGSARALLQISESEGFGLPIAEARALGTPVIVSDVRPLNDFYGQMPHVVQLGNATQLADMMEEMINNPEATRYPTEHQVSWADWSTTLFG